MLKAEFFVDDGGDGAGVDTGTNALEAAKRAFHRWEARLPLAVWRATAANRGPAGMELPPFPETGVFAPASPFYNKGC